MTFLISVQKNKQKYVIVYYDTILSNYKIYIDIL